jgi:hypothetical protein
MAESLPLFQHVVFSSRDAAKNTKRVNVNLTLCKNCQFVFNAAFEESQLDYGADYQNEQGYSRRFDDHLKAVVTNLLEKGYRHKKIIEIGCGKGTFLNKCRQSGFTNIKGYDPAFEGNDPDIVCDYFKGQAADEPADLIVLRHVLEHIAKPFDFLKTIALANHSQGTIYIEVPDFQWIVREKAFEDIYNEHCNYFTPQTLSSMFLVSHCNHSFEGQYLSFFGELNSLQSPRASGQNADFFVSQKVIQDRINDWKATLNNNKRRFIVVWGAGSKGIIFANLVDPHADIINYLVDINPKKQDKFIGGTGHEIIAPMKLKEVIGNIKHHDGSVMIIVANKNYLEEIKKEVAEFNPQILTL